MTEKPKQEQEQEPKISEYYQYYQQDNARDTTDLNFSLSPETGFAGWIKKHIYPLIPFTAITLLSVGSGFTTYYGMVAYAKPLIALLITVGIQALMFVFAVWLSGLGTLRQAKAFIITFGYAQAAAVSIFFSFNSFYELIDTAADRRQTSNLELRQKWSETFAKISGAHQAKIIADGSNIISGNNYTQFQNDFQQALSAMRVATGAIDASVGVRLSTIEQEEASQTKQIDQIDIELAQLGDLITQQQERRIRLLQNIKSAEDDIAALTRDTSRTPTNAEINALVNEDTTLIQLRESLAETEKTVADLQRQFAEKQQQAEQELTQGGTATETGASGAGAGPLYRQYIAEAAILEADLIKAQAGLAAIKRSVTDREADLRTQTEEQLTNRATDNANRLADLRNTIQSLNADIKTIDDNLASLRQTQSDLNSQKISMITQNSKNNSDENYPVLLTLRESLNKTQNVNQTANDVNLPGTITSIFEALELSKDLAAAQQACNEYPALAFELNRLSARLVLDETTRINMDNVRCTNVAEADSAGQTLRIRAENLQKFNEQCTADQIPAPPAVDNVLDNPRLSQAERDKLLAYSIVENGVLDSQPNLSQTAVSQAQQLSSNERREFIEQTLYRVDYEGIREHVQKCLGIINLQDGNSLVGAQTEITQLLAAYNPEAHSFTRTVSAFERSDRKAYIALIIAFAIDALILIFGLAGRNNKPQPVPNWPIPFAAGGPQGPATSNQSTWHRQVGPSLKTDQVEIIRKLCATDKMFMYLFVKSAWLDISGPYYQIPFHTTGMTEYYAAIGTILRSGIATHVPPNHITVESEIFEEIKQICKNEGVIDAV